MFVETASENRDERFDTRASSAGPFTIRLATRTNKETGPDACHRVKDLPKRFFHGLYLLSVPNSRFGADLMRQAYRLRQAAPDFDRQLTSPQ